MENANKQKQQLENMFSQSNSVWTLHTFILSSDAPAARTGEKTIIYCYAALKKATFNHFFPSFLTFTSVFFLKNQEFCTETFSPIHF